MSNLLNNPSGTLALREAVKDQVLRRMRRWFKRNTVIAFDDWVGAGKIPDLDLTTVLDDLNIEHDQEILDLFELLKRLEHDSTVINADLYVDTVNGDDHFGDGSIDAPFQTLPRAQRLIPAVIEGQINIFLSAPAANPATSMDDMTIEFKGRGQFCIQGTDPDIVHAGPFTVGTWTNIGVAMQYGHSIQLAAPAWVANEHRGRFVHALTGARAGSYYAIAENTTDTIYMANTYYPMANGDTFEIVSPGAHINVDAGLGSTRLTLTSKEDLWNYRSQFAMTHIRMDSIIEFDLNTISIVNPFTRFWVTMYVGNYGQSGHAPLFDPTQIQDPDLRLDDYPYTWVELLWLMGERLFIFRNTTLICSDGFGGEVALADSSFNEFSSWFGGDLHFSRMFCTTMGATLITANHGWTSIHIEGLWIRGCSQLVHQIKGNVYLKQIEGAQPTQYTVRIGANSSVDFDGTPVSGVLNGVIWQSTGVAAAFPVVAGTSITDGNGAYVVKMT